jgi:outer membrane protein
MTLKLSSVLTGMLVCSALTGCYPSVDHLPPPAPDQPWKPAQTDSVIPDKSKVDNGKTDTPQLAAALPSDPKPKFELPSGLSVPYRRDEVSVDSSHIYTLAELIDLAEQNNPDTRIAWEQAKQAAYGVGLAKATYLPEISAEVLGGVQHTPLPMPKDLVPKGYSITNTEEVVPGLAIKWLLFDFGKRDSEVEAAQKKSLASNIAFTGTHQKLIFEVSKAYFALDAERAQLHVAEDALKSSKTLQESAEAKGKNGLGTVTETAIAKRGTAQAEFDLARAQAIDNDAYHALLEAIGLTPTLKIGIADSSGRELPQSLAGDANDYIKKALAQRPDIAAAYAKVQASEAEISGAKASYYPTLGLEGLVNQNIGYLSIDGSHPYHVDDPAAAILLRLKLPLYDGGVRENNLSLARSKNEEAKQEMVKAQDEAIRQVAKAYDTVKAALAEYNAAGALVKASNTANAASLDAYKHGVGTFTDAVTSQTQKAQAQSAQAHAYATVLTAAAALAFSTGDLTSIDALNSPR